MATGTNVATEARRTLHDEESGSYRWSDAELIDYINAAQRRIAALVPEANSVETVVNITNEIARQSIPSGGIKFIRVARNYADDGSTPQGAVRYVEKDALDTYDPDWEYNTAIKTDGDNFFEHYCHDSREPRVFYLYPPQAAASKYVAVVYSDNPDEITALTDTLSLGDEYFDAIVEYTVYRSLTKEGRESIPSAYRQELYNNFLQALGLKRNSDSFVNAASNAPPGGQ